MKLLLLALLAAVPLVPAASAHVCGSRESPAPVGSCGDCDRGDHQHQEADAFGQRAACSSEAAAVPAPAAALVAGAILAAAVALRPRA